MAPHACARVPALVFPSRRRRREGDRFHPAWRDRPIKIKDFFRGQRVPLHHRDEVALVCDQEDEVSGAAGPVQPTLGGVRERRRRCRRRWGKALSGGTGTSSPRRRPRPACLETPTQVLAVYPFYPAANFKADTTGLEPVHVRVQGGPLRCPRPLRAPREAEGAGGAEGGGDGVE